MSGAILRMPGLLGRQRARAAAAVVPASRVPHVAVLCAPSRSSAAAAAVALALADALGAPSALAGVVGVADGARGIGATPSARRVAASLRERGVAAAAAGRLVWAADRRDSVSGREDVAAVAAAASAELGRAAAAGAPAALALPFPRTAALDRVLAWHDAIVVVREPDTSGSVLDRALASLAALGRPVASMAPPARFAGALAVAGLWTPPEAADAVTRLGLGDVRGGRGD